MRTSRFSPEQIIRALREAEDGRPVGELCRQLNVAEATFYGGRSSSAKSALRRRMRELAVDRISYGYRRVYILLRREGWHVNHKLARP